MATRADNLVRAAPLADGAGPTGRVSFTEVGFVTRTRDDQVLRQTQQEVELFQQPCSLKGLSSAVTGGMVGMLFGFVGGMWRNRSLKSLPLWRADGVSSAKYFAVMGGVYQFAQCLVERLRETDDGWNRGVAGCASGLAVGWKAGPLGAAQSCALFGVFSALFDASTGSAGPAQAAVLPGGGSSSPPWGRAAQRPEPAGGKAASHAAPAAGCTVAGASPHVRKEPRAVVRFAARQRPGGGTSGHRRVVDTPIVMWLGPVFSASYFSGQPTLSLNGGL